LAVRPGGCNTGGVTILWICGAGVVGGAETTTLALLERLRARGHEVVGLCRRDSRVADVLRAAGVSTVAARIGGAVNLRTRGAIVTILRAIKPDVALVTTVDEWVWACLARRPARTRLVLVRHMALALSWRVRRLAALRADAIVAVSQAVRQSLLNGSGITGERVHLIHNPVRLPPRAGVPEATERTAARRRLGLRTDGHWVGFFGGLRPEKGIRTVLDVVRRANEAVGLTNVLICGPSPGPLSAGSLAAAYSLTGRVHYLGEITAMTDAFTAADVVAMATPLRLSEAAPATLMEAMACGTPVVAYATGGIPEIIGSNAEAGYLARPDDANDLARTLIEALRNPAEAKRRANAGLDRVRSLFDPERSAARYEELFARLCHPRGEL
jgi:glycosyltransferase involved in cell wall biosynthesis